jgi:hypothetical protein
VRSPGGTDSTWVASRPWSGDPISEERRVARLEEAVKSVARSMGEERARQTARLEDIPSTAPAFTRLAVDEEGNIWARQLLNSDSTQTTFDVMDAHGAWLGTLRIPYGVAEYGGAYFGRGAVYLKTESDEGSPVIIRLRVK